MSVEKLSEEDLAVIAEEEGLLLDVQSRLAAHVGRGTGDHSDFDAQILDLRDQIAEARAEDHASLVEHMTRLASLRAQQNREVTFPTDPANPYFAHLRLKDVHRGQTRVRDILIGRRPFIDPKGSVQIVDWRNSPISRIYYCYLDGDDYEERFADELQRGHVELRRTVSIHDGVLRRIREEDRVLGRNSAGEWVRASADSRRLAGGAGTALRPPREGLGGVRPDQRLPEITALIDREQFGAITENRSGVVVIRGGAGTGKTTIALHRAAWMHFQDPSRYAVKKMLVLTPGDALRRYVAKVLPSLDVRGVPVKTFEGWAHETLKRLVPALRKRKLTDDTPMGARRLKRHPKLLAMLEKAVLEQGRIFDEIFETVGGKPLMDAWVRRRNLPAMRRLEGVEKWVKSDGKQIIGTARMFAVRKALERARAELGDPFETWADVLTDRAGLIAGLGDVQYYEWELDQLIKTVNEQADSPMDLGGVDASHRTGVDGRSIDEGDIRGKLDSDDLAILLRLCQLKYGRLAGPSGQSVVFEHIVVDEAQDHSPLVLKVVCDAVRPGGPVTLAGDTAQRLNLDNGFSDWDEVLALLKVKASILPPLAVSYRSTRQVMALARHVLGDLAPHEAPRDARDGAPVQLLRFQEQGEAVAFLADALKSLRSRERLSSVALVGRTAAVADAYYNGLRRAEVPQLNRIRHQEFQFAPGIDVTDIAQIKGLEYDYIVLLEPTGVHYPPTEKSRYLLHIGSTRAAHQLWLVSSLPPSPILPVELANGGTYPVEPPVDPPVELPVDPAVASGVASGRTTAE